MRNESLLQVAQKTGLSEPWKRIFMTLFSWIFRFQRLFFLCARASHRPKVRKLTKDTSEVGNGQPGSTFPVSESNPI